MKLPASSGRVSRGIAVATARAVLRPGIISEETGN